MHHSNISTVCILYNVYRIENKEQKIILKHYNVVLYLLCTFEVVYSYIHNTIFAVSLAKCFHGSSKPDCLALLAIPFLSKKPLGKCSPLI